MWTRCQACRSYFIVDEDEDEVAHVSNHKARFVTAGRYLQHVLPGLGRRLLSRAVNDHRFSMSTGGMVQLLKDQGFDVLHVSPKAAMHSDDSSLAVKTCYGVSNVLWPLLRASIATGAVVIARKPV